MQGKALQDFVIDKIDDLKGQDIIALDVQGKSSITDCMIICTGTSSRHVMSIADHVVQSSRAAGMLPLGVEGENAADWIVVDLGDVIVHVMQEGSCNLSLSARRCPTGFKRDLRNICVVFRKICPLS